MEEVVTGLLIANKWCMQFWIDIEINPFQGNINKIY